MSNEVNNLASSFVAMAQAFEQLPQVRQELANAVERNAELSEAIQRLELRIISLKSELDTANEATRKAEAERDDAERMFLDADDKVNAFRRLMSAFQTDVSALVKASEPTVAEGVSQPAVEAITKPVASEDHIDMGISMGQGATDPTTVPTPSYDAGQADSPNVSAAANGSTDGVSVQSDPTPASAETSSESVSPASISESVQSPESTDAERAIPNAHLRAPEVAPADPTASSEAGDGPSPVTATAIPNVEHSADAPTSNSPVDTSSDEDDVGYHNEPKIGNAGGSQDWDAWDSWAERMNKRYPAHLGGWPQRPTQAAQ